MSLLRTGIVLAAIVALLPSDKERQDELFAKAQALAGEAMTYCDRNAKTCANVSEALEGLAEKAKFAGAVALDILMRHGQLTPAATSLPGGEVEAVHLARGTLTQADLEPAWRGR